MVEVDVRKSADGTLFVLHDAQALAEPDGVWGRLLDAGVSVIQTDEPEALRAYLAR